MSPARAGTPHRAPVAALAAAAFGGALLLPFIYDDVPLIRDSAGFAAWGSLAQLAGPRYYAVFGVGNYHPLPLLAWFALRRLFDAPWPFHALSLAVHAANSWLVLRLSRLLASREPGTPEAVPWAAAALWAASPLHSQAVYVAAFLPDLSCAFFSLLCLDWALGSPPKQRLGARPLAAFAAALLCKETAAVLPLVLYALSRERGRAFLRGALLVLGAYAAFRLLAINDFEMFAATPAGGREAWFEPGVRVAAALRLMVWPAPLALMRSSPGPSLFLGAGFWLAAAVAASFAWTATARSGGGPAGRAAAWSFLWLLPFLGLLPFAHARNYFAGRFLCERYLYLASLGFFWLAGSFLGRLGPRLRGAALVAAAAASIAGAWGEFGTYRDPVRLWSRSVAAAPGSLWARNFLGVTYLDAGRPKDGLGQFEAALALRTGLAWERSVTYSNLGAALDALGRRREGALAYRHALVTDPANREARRHVPGPSAPAAGMHLLD